MNYTQQGCSATCGTSNLKFISNLEIVSITVIFLQIYGLFFTSQPILKSIDKDFLLCHHVISINCVCKCHCDAEYTGRINQSEVGVKE